MRKSDIRYAIADMYDLERTLGALAMDSIVNAVFLAAQPQMTKGGRYAVQVNAPDSMDMLTIGNYANLSDACIVAEAQTDMAEERADSKTVTHVAIDDTQGPHLMWFFSDGKRVDPMGEGS